MAKVRVTDYTFTPGAAGAGTVVIAGHHNLAQLLLMTNTTTNQIIYNFASSGSGGTVVYDAATHKTTVTLDGDTSSMSSTDDLQIFVDQAEAPMTVAPKLFDPVEKMRVSNPQALIDTDFEYSLQATKWESVQLQGNIPGIYQKANEPAFQGPSVLSILPASGGLGYTASATAGNFEPEYGRSGMTVRRSSSGGVDNSRYSLYPGFPIYYLGNTTSRMYMGTNGILYVYTGFGSSTTLVQGVDQPNYPAIKFFARDMRMYWLGYERIGSTEFRIRWEGDYDSSAGGPLGSSSNPPFIVEFTFYRNDDRVNIHYIKAARGTTGGTGGNYDTGLQDGNGPSNVYLADWSVSQNAVSPYTVSDQYEVRWGQAQAGPGAVEVTVDPASNPSFGAGQPIVLKDTKDPLYLDGAFLITGTTASNKFTIETKSPTTYVGDQKTDYSAIYTGGFFYKAEMPFFQINKRINEVRAELNFGSIKHSLYVGSKLYVVDSNNPNAEWTGAVTVDNVLDENRVTYRVSGLTPYANSDPLGLASAGVKVYARNEGVSQHRFFDGGVSINPSTHSPDAQIIRQTRKYFRYQSGKGIQFSTGVLFRPVYDIASIEVDSSMHADDGYIVAIIETDVEHGFNSPLDYRPGAQVTISGIEEVIGSTPTGVYNGTFTIANVVDRLRFSIEIPIAGSILALDENPGGLGKVAVTGWQDSVVRSGMFDEQNGIFFEHDGFYLYGVKRDSTQQMTGKIAVNEDENIVTGTNTKFETQIAEGDYVVIKGTSYQVRKIFSDTSLQIVPNFKGYDTDNQKFVKTTEIRVRQDQFNIDKLDGTGPSGYILDPNKMQMVFIDYSWYGAGKIRWGIRVSDGTILYVHEERQNNVNTEAYMRSGNLPGRFEIQTKGKRGKLVGAILNSDNTTKVYEDEFELMPNKGTILVGDEYIGYEVSAIQPGNIPPGIKQIDLERNLYELDSNPLPQYSGGTPWLSINQNCSPTLSHWGVSCLMDGAFDEDKSYLFTAKNENRRIVQNGQRLPLVSIRLAPSVDYGIPGFYSIRNLINRSALKLESVGVACSGSFDIEIVLNTESSIYENNSNWSPAPNGSIAQYVDHSVVTSGSFEGGDVVGAFIPEQGSGKFATSTFQISQIRELGNSILGGPGVFPDGPDIMTIFATARSNNSSIQARFSWSESQG